MLFARCTFLTPVWPQASQSLTFDLSKNVQNGFLSKRPK